MPEVSWRHENRSSRQEQAGVSGFTFEVSGLRFRFSGFTFQICDSRAFQPPPEFHLHRNLKLET